MLKGLAGLGSMLKQAQEMGGKMKALQEELKSKRVTGIAGGGMVEIEATGTGEVISCRIDPNIFEQGDRELLEDLVVTAVNQAQAKAKQLHADAMQSMTGGMNLPGLDEALSQFTGPQDS
jgi:nucleoid-associated protein EbfC